MSDIVGVDQLKTEICRTLVADWNERRAGRAMPVRADIDPTTMPKLVLPHVFLIEIIGDETAPRFVYRILGTTINAMTGRDITGKEIGSETYGELAEPVLKPFRRVAATGKPAVIRVRAAYDQARFESEAVCLPLGSGDRPDYIIGAVARLDESRTTFAGHRASQTTIEVFELAP